MRAKGVEEKDSEIGAAVKEKRGSKASLSGSTNNRSKGFKMSKSGDEEGGAGANSSAR